MKNKYFTALIVLILLVLYTGLMAANLISYSGQTSSAGYYADEPNLPAADEQDPNDPNVAVPE